MVPEVLVGVVGFVLELVFVVVMTGSGGCARGEVLLRGESG